MRAAVRQYPLQYILSRFEQRREGGYGMGIPDEIEAIKVFATFTIRQILLDGGADLVDDSTRCQIQTGRILNKTYPYGL